MGRGEIGLLPDRLPQPLPLCSPPKYPDAAVLFLIVSSMVPGYLSGIKLLPGEAIEDVFAMNLYRSADF